MKALPDVLIALTYAVQVIGLLLGAAGVVLFVRTIP